MLLRFTIYVQSYMHRDIRDHETHDVHFSLHTNDVMGLLHDMGLQLVCMLGIAHVHTITKLHIMIQKTY